MDMKDAQETFNKLKNFTFPDSPKLTLKLQSSPMVSTRPSNEKSPPPSPTKISHKRYSQLLQPTPLDLLSSSPTISSTCESGGNSPIENYYPGFVPAIPRRVSLNSLKHQRNLSISSNPLSVDSCIYFNPNHLASIDSELDKHRFEEGDDEDNRLEYSITPEYKYNDISLRKSNYPGTTPKSKSTNDILFSLENFNNDKTEIMKSPSNISFDDYRRSSVIYIVSNPTQRDVVDLNVIDDRLH